MPAKVKKGDKMRKGPTWKLISPGGAEFTGTLREVLHVWRGKRVAVFYMGKRKI